MYLHLSQRPLNPGGEPDQAIAHRRVRALAHGQQEVRQYYVCTSSRLPKTVAAVPPVTGVKVRQYTWHHCHLNKIGAVQPLYCITPSCRPPFQNRPCLQAFEAWQEGKLVVEEWCATLQLLPPQGHSHHRPPRRDSPSSISTN